MKAFQTWTPRVRRLIYDALRQDVGCQAITGTDFAGLQAFEQVCTFDHDAASPIFNQAANASYTDGPFNVGSLPPWSTKWAAWVGSHGVRVGKLASVTPPGDNAGAPSSLFDNLSPLPAKVTIGFTSQGQMGIAIQKDAANIQIKWFKDNEGTYGDLIFPGTSPVLFGDARLLVTDNATDADLVLFYLNALNPKAVYARFEREQFVTEHVINSDLPNALTSLISTAALSGRQKLYARDEASRDVTLTSPAYTPAATHDKGALTLGFDHGDYRQSSLPAVVNTGHKASLTIAIAAGAYSDVIVEPASALSGDAADLTIAIESGEYA